MYIPTENATRGKCAQQFSYGFKSLVKLGVWNKISKSQQVGGFFKFDTKLQILRRFLLFLSKKTTIF